MIISEGDLMKWATAYIEDGKIKKWRYDSCDEENMDYILNVKQYSQELLTDREILYIKGFNNVIIINGKSVIFHNFSGDVYKIK